MKQSLKLSIKYIVVSIFFLMPTFVLAGSESVMNRMNTFSQNSGYAGNVSESTMAEIIGQAISVFLGLLGVIFVILVILAGYKYFMAQGNEGETKTALDSIRRAIIGLIIIVGSFAIWRLIETSFLRS